jgi:hypothetical protein
MISEFLLVYNAFSGRFSFVAFSDCLNYCLDREVPAWPIIKSPLGRPAPPRGGFLFWLFAVDAQSAHGTSPVKAFNA